MRKKNNNILLFLYFELHESSMTPLYIFLSYLFQMTVESFILILHLLIIYFLKWSLCPL